MSCSLVVLVNGGEEAKVPGRSRRDRAAVGGGAALPIVSGARVDPGATV